MIHIWRFTLRPLPPSSVSTRIVKKDRFNERISALTKLSKTESGVNFQSLLFCQRGTDVQAKSGVSS
jgi:hypothetical protein